MLAMVDGNEALLRRTRAMIAMDLLPSRLTSLETGVREHLNGMLLQ